MTASPLRPSQLRSMAKKIRLLLLDLDGVLTDAGLHYDGEGRETKTFFAMDGVGIRLLREISGIPTAVVSGRGSKAAQSRMKDLDIAEFHFHIKDKGKTLREIQNKFSLQPSEICAIGDDIVDLPLLIRVGLPVAPANAHHEVKRVAKFITKSSGGKGAEREVCEILMKARGEWRKALSHYKR